MKPLLALLGVVTGAMVTTLGINNTAFAADFSFRGTFAQDDDVHLFDFSVGTKSVVTFRTYSYAGGTQADGTVIAAGGFDPIMSLFDAQGKLIAIGDDGDSGTVAEDPTTRQAYDVLLDIALMAGNYTVALSQYDNFPNTYYLADGFRETGNGNFTGHLERCPIGSSFCDFTGDVRTNQWAFDAFGVLPLLEADEDELPVIDPPEDEDDDEPVTDPSEDGDGDGDDDEPVTDPSEDGDGDEGDDEPVTDPSEDGDEDEGDDEPVTDPSEDGDDDEPVIDPPVIIPPILEPGDNPAAVPEPTTTVALALAGLGALVTLRRNQ